MMIDCSFNQAHWLPQISELEAGWYNNWLRPEI